MVSTADQNVHHAPQAPCVGCLVVQSSSLLTQPTDTTASGLQGRARTAQRPLLPNSGRPSSHIGDRGVVATAADLNARHAPQTPASGSGAGKQRLTHPTDRYNRLWNARSRENRTQTDQKDHRAIFRVDHESSLYKQISERTGSIH